MLTSGILQINRIKKISNRVFVLALTFLCGTLCAFMIISMVPLGRESVACYLYFLMCIQLISSGTKQSAIIPQEH